MEFLVGLLFAAAIFIFLILASESNKEETGPSILKKIGNSLFSNSIVTIAILEISWVFVLVSMVLWLESAAPEAITSTIFFGFFFALGILVKEARSIIKRKRLRDVNIQIMSEGKLQ